MFTATEFVVFGASPSLLLLLFFSFFLLFSLGRVSLESQRIHGSTHHPLAALTLNVSLTTKSFHEVAKDTRVYASSLGSLGLVALICFSFSFFLFCFSCFSIFPSLRRGREVVVCLVEKCVALYGLNRSMSNECQSLRKKLNVKLGSNRFRDDFGLPLLSNEKKLLGNVESSYGLSQTEPRPSCESLE